jgi:hypothetical protein
MPHIDLDKETLDRLLGKLERGQWISKEEAKELKILLEKELDRALDKGNTNLAIKISSLLIGLNGYVSSIDSVVDSSSVNVKPVLS